MDLPSHWFWGGKPYADEELHELIRLTRFQPNPPPIAPPPRREEKIAVARYRALRERIHEGPLYTVLGDHSRVTKRGAVASSAVVIDPFEGMPTYGQKYKKQRRKIPRLDTRPYVLRFFPNELWTTLDPTTNDPTTKPGAKAAAHKKRQKLLKIALSTKLTRLEELEGEDGEGLGRDEDEDLDKDEDEDAGPHEEEEQDDDFEEDEDDDDDYNAENYFDNGEDDEYGDEGGGGGDDYDF
ncbi:DNA-directed RNA polymerase III subunit C31 [Diplodia seriata]|uniref:DNA-directed RNA polymerase III subunit n=1 Tax=Diplodia seriata TaxID=420778 RepID=A0ABR3CWL8_9PEZI